MDLGNVCVLPAVRCVLICTQATNAIMKINNTPKLKQDLYLSVERTTFWLLFINLEGCDNLHNFLYDLNDFQKQKLTLYSNESAPLLLRVVLSTDVILSWLIFKLFPVTVIILLKFVKLFGVN